MKLKYGWQEEQSALDQDPLVCWGSLGVYILHKVLFWFFHVYFLLPCFCERFFSFKVTVPECVLFLKCVLPEAQMPDTPVLNEMYETGLLHPETPYKVWFVHSCSLKLAVTMFTPTELECCHQNLAAHRLVVPDPAPTFLNCTKYLATDTDATGHEHHCTATSTKS